MLIPYPQRAIISIVSCVSGQLRRTTQINQVVPRFLPRLSNDPGRFPSRRERSRLKCRESGESLARQLEGGQSGRRESGSFGTGPSVLEAWGENAVCLLDRDACSAERLYQLSRCFIYLLSERAAPRHVSESIGVLRRGATGMR